MKKYFWLIAILVVGTLLRIYHNTDISLWHDEAFSALMIRYPWPEMFRRLALDVHPPMYYIALRLWHYVFGDRMWSLRGFSVLFGVLGIWAVWLFTKEAFKNEKMALWAAFFVALSPYVTDYSTEARMYTFGAFFAVIAAYFLIKALREQKAFHDDEKLNMPNLPKDIKLKKQYLWNYFWFAICTAIIMLTHYYLLFTAAALMLYGLYYCVMHYRKDWKSYVPFLVSCLLSLVLFLPQLPTFISQIKSVGQSYWIPAIDFWSIPGTVWTILLSIGHDNSHTSTLVMMVIVCLFTIFFFWQFLRKTQMAEKWLVTFCFVAPFLGALAFAALAKLKGSASSVYQERYFLYGGIFFYIAFAAWLSELKIKALSATLFVLYCLFNIYVFFHNWNGLDISQKPGMNGAAHYLGANVQLSDHMFVGSSFEFFNYKYYELTYYPIPTRPLLYTGGRSDISQISSVEGVALLSNADLGPSFSQGVHPGDTTWLLWTNGFGGSKPQVPLNWTQVDEQSFADVRPYVGTTIYVDEYKVN
jgi:4-amino-4-deoxy-L-arabinose transferase-like glycosyltransferase